MKMYNNSSIMIQSKVLNSLSVNKKELKSFIYFPDYFCGYNIKFFALRLFVDDLTYNGCHINYGNNPSPIILPSLIYDKEIA